MHYKIVELSFDRRRVMVANEVPTSTIEVLADEYGCDYIHILQKNDRKKFMLYYNRWGGGIQFNLQSGVATVAAAEAWFAPRLENLRNELEGLGIEDFCKTRYADGLVDIIEKKFDTLIYSIDYDGIFSLDEFIRLRYNYGDEGKLTYVGRIFDYHI